MSFDLIIAIWTRYQNENPIVPKNLRSNSKRSPKSDIASILNSKKISKAYSIIICRSKKESDS